MACFGQLVDMLDNLRERKVSKGTSLVLAEESLMFKLSKSDSEVTRVRSAYGSKW